MKKVKFQHEEGDVLYAVELDQDRLRDELDCSCEDLATASRKIISDCWATREGSKCKTEQRLEGKL